MGSFLVLHLEQVIIGGHLSHFSKIAASRLTLGNLLMAKKVIFKVIGRIKRPFSNVITSWTNFQNYGDNTCISLKLLQIQVYFAFIFASDAIQSPF